MDILSLLGHELSASLVYLIVGVVVVASGLPVVTLVLAAEPVLLLATVLAAQGRVSLAVLFAITIAGSVAGDTLSYLIGRWCGPRVLVRNGLRRHRGRLIKAYDTARHRGMVSVIAQRWIPPARGFVPAVIGAARMPFNRFILAATAAAALWASLNVLVLYFAGAQIMMLLPLPIAAVLIVRFVRRRRARGRDVRTSPTEADTMSKTPTPGPSVSRP